MKILEVCEFSAGICGVWNRVLSESLEFIKLGDNITVFSSDIEKGSGRTVSHNDNIHGVNIIRFNSIKNLFSKNVNYFDFKEEFNRLNPDAVITHTIHPHSFQALELCRKKNIPCFLVTHAPFNVKRIFPLNLITSLYYLFNVKPKIGKFSGIFTITKWEVPYLEKLGIDKTQLVYAPNCIPENFFREKIIPFKGEKIIFLGRIAPVKNIELLVNAFKKINKNLALEIIGPVEKGYEEIQNLESEKIKFLPPLYSVREKIKKMQEADIFILPSFREAMPQSLIEAMALGKIVISSDTDGGKEIIKHKQNGLLFETGNEKQLINTINDVLSMNKAEVLSLQKNSRKTAENFQWSKIIKKIRGTIHPF